MKKIFLTILLFLFLLVGTWVGYLWVKLPFIYSLTEDIFSSIESSQIDPIEWVEIQSKARQLPNVYPVSLIRSSFLEGANIVFDIDTLREQKNIFGASFVPTEDILRYFNAISQIEVSLGNIEKNIQRFPNFFLSSDQKGIKESVLFKISMAREVMNDVLAFEQMLKTMVAKQERMLVLFQNPNEPRSTGGFTGSLVLIDFTQEVVSWRFADVYEYDRLVPEYSQLPAPEFFHPLSKTISLRDANFFPHFEASAKAYQHFFKSIGQKVPTSVVAVNISLAQELLRLIGPVKLEQWDIEVTDDNVDVVLQFLLGSGIEGRFSVKQPIMVLAEKIFSVTQLQGISNERLAAFDLQAFLDAKNVLAYSQDTALQRLFEKWNIDGSVKQAKTADNFLYFDFISVGANKSEKFLWTKIEHTSLVSANGKVENTLKIKRTHALQVDELEALLGYKKWMPNIQSLLTQDLKWVLGEGENRTYLRVFVPKKSELKVTQSPSGAVLEKFSSDGFFRVFEVPLFVVPGESLEVELRYNTLVTRGNYDYRPYNLQVVGTPARRQTSFMSTVVTSDAGRFTAQTYNIGRPMPLINQFYRSLIEY